ncbi:MAG: MBL fold metallo-hydrolase [Armatimonadetes bacterium]|nr:MBL fold metallo-hydrolase [Armatimonadota bacterium]
MALEDALGDVVGKAMRGQKVSAADLAARAGLTTEQVEQLLDYAFAPDEEALGRIGRALGLRGENLVKIARDIYSPDSSALWPTVRVISSPYTDFYVNAFLVWGPSSEKAVLFDTGTDFGAIQQLVDANKLTVDTLALTHTHGDHVAVLDDVVSHYHPTILASPKEPVPGAQLVKDGDSVQIGSLSIIVRETEGHSPGGLTFVVNRSDTEPALAVVGDAIFAGSAGGAAVSYEDLHRNIRTKILSLPDDTLILPGHGPVTTVGQEKENNPFAPAMA